MATIKREKINMNVVIYTNKGHVREHNEDAIFAANNVISGCNMVSPLEFYTESKNNCFAVIDGMGGYEGGEKAARIVAASFLENLEKLNMMDAKNKITLVLNDATQKISHDIKNSPELYAMGAALAGVIFDLEKILIFNCGDCRVYHKKKGKTLEKLSHDHSIVQELFNKGEIDENEMRFHKQKNIITSCISAFLESLNIYFTEISMSEYEKFFICSDGVWETLSMKKIEKCFCEDNLETAKNLVKELSNMNEKCRDNISFIII